MALLKGMSFLVKNSEDERTQMLASIMEDIKSQITNALFSSIDIATDVVSSKKHLKVSDIAFLAPLLYVSDGAIGGMKYTDRGYLIDVSFEKDTITYDDEYTISIDITPDTDNEPNERFNINVNYSEPQDVMIIKRGEIRTSYNFPSKRYLSTVDIPNMDNAVMRPYKDDSSDLIPCSPWCRWRYRSIPFMFYSNGHQNIDARTGTFTQPFLTSRHFSRQFVSKGRLISHVFVNNGDMTAVATPYLVDKMDEFYKKEMLHIDIKTDEKDLWGERGHIGWGKLVYPSTQSVKGAFVHICSQHDISFMEIPNYIAKKIEYCQNVIDNNTDAIIKDAFKILYGDEGDEFFMSVEDIAERMKEVLEKKDESLINPLVNQIRFRFVDFQLAALANAACRWGSELLDNDAAFTLQLPIKIRHTHIAAAVCQAVIKAIDISEAPIDLFYEIT